MMLLVKLEIWPFGNEGEAREIGRLKIGNDGSGDRVIGNYVYELTDERGVIVSGELNNFPRMHGAWKLVSEILQNAAIKNNGDLK